MVRVVVGDLARWLQDEEARARGPDMDQTSYRLVIDAGHNEGTSLRTSRSRQATAPSRSPSIEVICSSVSSARKENADKSCGWLVMDDLRRQREQLEEKLQHAREAFDSEYRSIATVWGVTFGRLDINAGLLPSSSRCSMYCLTRSALRLE